MGRVNRKIRPQNSGLSLYIRLHSRRRLLSASEDIEPAGNGDSDGDREVGCGSRLPSAKKIVENAWFRRFVLFSIILSCSMLASYNPLDESANDWLGIAEIVFQTVFTIEMVLKLNAFGCRGYWKDGWNRLDGVIVIFGWVAFIPVDLGDSGNTSIFRIARILRPLRIITVVSRLKIIVDTLFSSLPELRSVMVFLVFFLALSSILGVQLFQGDFHQRCGAFNGSSFIFEEPWDNMLCSMSSEPSYGMHVCDANATCGISAETPMNGIISYDNFLDALLVNTIAISIGLWSTFMSWMEQVNGAWAEVYFIFLELFGSLFVLELVVAVLFSHLESNKRLYYQSLHEKMPPLKRRNATRDILALEEPPPSLCCRSIRYGEELYCKLSKQEAKPSATVEDTDVSRCSSCWSRMRTKCKALAELEWFERFVFLLIVINTACLSLTRYDQPVSEVYAMNIANLVFTVLFTLEAGIKIMGLGGAYFDESWNCFDFAVVVVGWTEVVVVVILPAESVFLNGVRALRILRIVRMFKTWQTMQKYLVQLYHCVQSAGPPFLLLAVVMFAFSLCGLQFFGGLLHYDKAQVLAGELERECPREKLFYYPYCPKRENFDSFGSAWVACFQVITSEITVVFSSIQAISYFTLIFYLALIVVGVFLLINVFLVVLMQAFSSSIDEKPNKCLSFPAAAKLLHVLLGMKRRAQQRLGQAENGLSYRKCSGGSKPIQVQRIRHPSAPYKALKILKWSHPLRALCAKVALSKAFDRMVLLLIIASCVVLTIDSGATCKHAPAYAETSPILSPETCHALATVDLCFNIIFLLEALVKIIAFGFAGHPGAYTRSNWNRLDLFVVATSLAGTIMATFMDSSALTASKALRALRVLRVLRAIRHYDGLRVVFVAFIKAAHKLLHLCVFVLLAFWIFGLIANALFQGGLRSCTDPARRCYSGINGVQVLNRTVAGITCTVEEDCVGYFLLGGSSAKPLSNASAELGLRKAWISREWVNPKYTENGQAYSFDSVPEAMLVLFEVSTLEAWVPVMYAAMDITAVGFAPVRFSNDAAAVFFMAFIIASSFTLLQLFVGFVAFHFNSCKEKYTSKFLSQTQIRLTDRLRANAIVRITAVVKPIRTSSRLRQKAFTVVSSRRFEFFVMAMISANVVLLACDHFRMAPDLRRALDSLNILFGVFFFVEAVVKIYALGALRYFSSSWNRLDFVVAMLVIVEIGLAISHIAIAINFNAVRSLRLLRMLRLVQHVEGLRSLFRTLYTALPAFLNVLALVFVVFYVYAVLGLELFSDLAGNGPNGGLNEYFNFATFHRSMLLLFRVTSGESWHTIMREVAVQSSFAIPYFISFIVLAQFMLLPLVIGLFFEVLEREKSLAGINSYVTDELVNKFYAAWDDLSAADQRTTWLPVEKLYVLIASLDVPLGSRNPGDIRHAPKPEVLRQIYHCSTLVVVDGKIHRGSTLKALIAKGWNELVGKRALQVLSEKSVSEGENTCLARELFAALEIQRWFRSRRFRLAPRCSGRDHNPEPRLHSTDQQEPLNSPQLDCRDLAMV